MASDTKERILRKSLEMFAENGYRGTNLRELAQSLELSKSALYRHFDSKEEIWNALVNQMSEYYDSRFCSPEILNNAPESLDSFYETVMKMVSFTVSDRNIILTRKVLSSEQFHSESASKLASEHFLFGLEKLFTEVFKNMQQKGLLIKTDPGMLSFCFTTPVSALIHQCDREPERREEYIGKISLFVKYFCNTYARKN